MATLIPEARLIYLVRDPIERIASHWVHNYARRREKGDLATTLHHPGSSYVVRSCYYRQLEHFLEHFDGSQVMVIESAELNNRRLHTLRRVFAFLGVDPDFYHPGFDSLIHRSAAKRRGSRLSVGLSRLSRKVLGFRVHVPLWASVEAALGLSGRIPATGNVREALGEGVIDILRDDAEKLRAHTGLDLDHWSVFQDPPGSVR